MLPLPWWGRILLTIALKLGLPAISKFVGPETAATIKATLEWILAAPTLAERRARAKQVGVRLEECVGDSCTVKNA
jgi:hypothetical protein